jgi:hypothetical protein
MNKKLIFSIQTLDTINVADLDQDDEENRMICIVRANINVFPFHTFCDYPEIKQGEQTFNTLKGWIYTNADSILCSTPRTFLPGIDIYTTLKVSIDPHEGVEGVILNFWSDGSEESRASKYRVPVLGTKNSTEVLSLIRDIYNYRQERKMKSYGEIPIRIFIYGHTTIMHI